MTGNRSPLHMIQMFLDGRQLIEVGKMMGLPLNQSDNHYLSHCLIRKLFGDAAPKPYWLEDDPNREQRREMRLLGYGNHDSDALVQRAKTFAEPGLYEAFDLQRLASKPMPQQFEEGTRLGFELRVCPVVRKANDGPKWNEGQEIDAFLSRVWEIDDETVDVSREKVYIDWLERQLELREGAQLIKDTINMKRFSIERMMRRTQEPERKVRIIKRPDVTLTGDLVVEKSESFLQLLERGIGRHKSFGFGMLKVRPPGNQQGAVR